MAEWLDLPYATRSNGLRIPHVQHGESCAPRVQQSLHAPTTRVRISSLSPALRDRAAVARRAHNPEVVGSNPTPATSSNPNGRMREHRPFAVCCFAVGDRPANSAGWPSNGSPSCWSGAENTNRSPTWTTLRHHRIDEHFVPANHGDQPAVPCALHHPADRPPDPGRGDGKDADAVTVGQRQEVTGRSDLD